MYDGSTSCVLRPPSVRTCVPVHYHHPIPLTRAASSKWIVPRARHPANPRPFPSPHSTLPLPHPPTRCSALPYMLPCAEPRRDTFPVHILCRSFRLRDAWSCLARPMIHRPAHPFVPLSFLLPCSTCACPCSEASFRSRSTRFLFRAAWSVVPPHRVCTPGQCCPVPPSRLCAPARQRCSVRLTLVGYPNMPHVPLFRHTASIHAHRTCQGYRRRLAGLNSLALSSFGPITRRDRACVPFLTQAGECSSMRDRRTGKWENIGGVET